MLWLKKHHPELFDESVMNQSVLDSGSEVGDLAMGLFGNFTEVPYGDLSEMICKTDNLIASEEQNIAEASFTYDGLFCSVDILRNLGGGNLELYEVKSSTSVHDILDTSHFIGKPDSQQYQRLLYIDLLYLQRQHVGRHEHDYGYSLGSCKYQANDHGHHSNPGGWHRTILLGDLCADEEQSNADDHRCDRSRRFHYQFVQHHGWRLVLHGVIRHNGLPEHIQFHHIHR